MSQAADGILAIGAKAPEFKPESFLTEDGIEGLKLGQKYVLEFSGTNCGPCIKGIPELEQLKNKHRSFKYVTIFSESAEDVRRFADGIGKELTGPVAIDPSGIVDATWMQAANVRGIPFVFVVSEDQKIAWMGAPSRLPTILPMLEADGALSREELIRAELMHQSKLLAERDALREEEADRFQSDTIFRLINEGRHAEAVVAIDEALKKYADLPEFIESLERRKFLELGYIPGTREQATQLAMLIAAKAYNRDDATIPNLFVQHYGESLPTNKDRDFVFLALALMDELGVPHSDDEADQYMDERNYYSSRAEALRFLGRNGEAKLALVKSIAAAEGLLASYVKNKEHELNINGAANVLAQLREREKSYDKPLSE